MLFLGSVQGGPEVAASCFGRMENKLMNLISDVVGEFAVGLSAGVNVVFHIPGSMWSDIEFKGLRDAKFSRAQKLLMVQVAVPKAMVACQDEESVRKFLFDSLREANRIAIEVFKKKGIEYSPQEYSAIVDAVEATLRGE